MTATRFLQALAVVSVIGLGVFGWIASRQVDVRRAPSEAAQLALRAQRQAIGDMQPLFDLDAGGKPVCRPKDSTEGHPSSGREGCW